MKRFISVLILIAMFICPATASATEDYLNKTVSYILGVVTNPTVSSAGGEWTIIGLAESGADIPDGYFDKYYENLCMYVADCGGVLHQRKYTEYSRVILSLAAIGKDPYNVNGYNLVSPLDNFDKVVWQGLNGAIYALIALDSINYDDSGLPDRYIDYILSFQNSDGGFPLNKEQNSDIEITAMAIQALSKHTDHADITDAVKRGLDFIANMQDSDGGFSNQYGSSSEICSQVLMALTSVDAASDERFVKNGKTPLDALLSYSLPDGSFEHISGNGSNLMATEQALCALSGYESYINEENKTYYISHTDKLQYIFNHLAAAIHKIMPDWAAYLPGITAAE